MTSQVAQAHYQWWPLAVAILMLTQHSEEFFPYMQYYDKYPGIPEYVEDGNVFRNLTADQIYGFPGNNLRQKAISN